MEAGIIFFWCPAISTLPLVCHSQTSLPVRRGRSIFSSFFEKIHKLVEEKEKILAKHKESEKEEEKEQQDVVVIKENGCRTEFVVVESVHYALVRRLGLESLVIIFYSQETTKECVSQNVTNCREEPYQHCKDVVRDVCRDTLGQECRDKLHEECATKFKEEVSNSKVRECNKECLEDPKYGQYIRYYPLT